MGGPAENACVPVPCPPWEEATLEIDLSYVPTLEELRQAGAVYAAPNGMYYAERDGRVVLLPGRPGAMDMRPVSTADACSMLQEGLHTALRKAVDSIQAQQAHRAISALPVGEWNAAVKWTVLALEGMGYRFYHNPGECV